jgi:hypothetical protein
MDAKGFNDALLFMAVVFCIVAAIFGASVASLIWWLI